MMGMEIMYHWHHNHRQNIISAKESRVERVKAKSKERAKGKGKSSDAALIVKMKKDGDDDKRDPDDPTPGGAFTRWLAKWNFVYK